MFSFSLKRVYNISRVCDKVLVRNIRGGRLGSKVANPGLNHRLAAFKKDGIKIQDDDAEEFIEQSDMDLFNAGEAYNSHVNETLMGKYILRHQVVKEKYFKENMPNLLTWSEKEQIRYLCNQHPEEWNPERIAESFPVTVHVVKKLLKFPWKPASKERIERHDNSARRNWKDLKDGLLDIPEDLRNHFLKFSERKIPPLRQESFKIDVTHKEDNMGEFEQIVQRCASKEDEEYSNIKSEAETEENTEKVRPKSYKKFTTLDSLAGKIKQRLASGQTIDAPDELIVRAMDENKSNDEQVTLPIEFDDNEKKVSVSANEEIVAVASYPERIRIPKKSYQKGATYKVNDCYYDSDGRFLYRVIGMTS